MTGGNVETSVRMCDWLLCALLCQWCGKNDDSMTSKKLMIEECNEDRLEARPYCLSPGASVVVRSVLRPTGQIARLRHDEQLGLTGRQICRRRSGIKRFEQRPHPCNSLAGRSRQKAG